MILKRRQHSAEFKFRVALAAVRKVNNISELASQHDVHPTPIRKWKQKLLQDIMGPALATSIFYLNCAQSTCFPKPKMSQTSIECYPISLFVVEQLLRSLRIQLTSS